MTRRDGDVGVRAGGRDGRGFVDVARDGGFVPFRWHERGDPHLLCDVYICWNQTKQRISPS